MTREERHLDWARSWLRRLLADRKQARSESTARSLASRLRWAERDATERAALRVEAIADECEAAIPAAIARTGEDRNARLIGMYGVNLLRSAASALRDEESETPGSER